MAKVPTTNDNKIIFEPMPTAVGYITSNLPSKEIAGLAEKVRPKRPMNPTCYFEE
jgi:hypothetical protein